MAAATTSATAIPLLYSGQELPNLKRIKFFDKDTIAWKGTNELHDFYKTLLNLHTNHPALRSGDTQVKAFRIKTSDAKNVFAFLRKNGAKEVLVLLNMSGEKDLHFDITDEKVNGVFRNAFSGAESDFIATRSFEM